MEENASSDAMGMGGPRPIALDELIELMESADELRQKFFSTEDLDLLEECTKLYRRALDHPLACLHRAYLCADVAIHLKEHFDLTGRRSLLDEAIVLEREVLDLRPAEDPGHGEACSNLAASLVTVYERTSDDVVLKEAINLFRKALGIHPVGNPNRSTSCVNLAVSLKTRFYRTGDEELMNEAIALEREALELRPVGHPRRSTSCANLAVSLSRRFKQTGDEHLLNEAIALNREALELRPVGHLDRSSSCVNLAASLVICFDRTGDVKLLDEAIALQREALTLQPVGHPERYISCITLAFSLKTHFHRTGDGTLLDEAIGLGREALELQPVGHPDRFSSYANLAVSLYTRFNQTGDEKLLDEAIALQREALELLPLGHPDRSVSCVNLAASLKTCFNRTGDKTLLDEAIALDREALELQPLGHPDRSTSCVSLAVSLKTRFNLTGDKHLLDEAIALEREALELRPVGHPDRSSSCVNLADSLAKHFSETGEEKLLIEAIALDREALELLPVGHTDRHMSCVNLAVSLRTHYNRTGDEHLLDEAIALEREALELLPVGHRDRFLSVVNLAVLLRTRFDRTGDEKLLDEAIALHRDALKSLPVGRRERSVSCVNLAASLKARFHRTGDEELLDEFIALDREALELHPVGHLDRPISCSNLADSLLICFNRTEDERLLNEAIALYREALDLRPVGHPDRSISCVNLAGSYEIRYYGTGDEKSLVEAVVLATEVLSLLPIGHPGRWRALVRLARMHIILTHTGRNLETALDYVKEALAFSADNVPQLLSSVSDFLTRLERSCTHPGLENTMLWIYSSAIDLASLVAGFLLDHDAQLQYLSNCRHFGPSAYFIANSFQNTHLGLRLLERARGIIWSQLLHLRDPDPLLERVPPALSQELNHLLQKFSRYRSSEPGNHVHHTSEMPHMLRDRDSQHSDHARLQQLIRDIRSQPGLEDFMHGPPVEELVKVASAHPVVVLVAKDEVCQALVIHPFNVSLSSIDLPGVYPSQFQVIVRNAIRYGNVDDSTRDDDSDDNDASRAMRPWQPPRGGMLAMLWRYIVKPVLDHLGIQKADGSTRPRIHWCPTGAFSFVPLHAAGIYEGPNQECSADYVVSSYTPTLAALRRAQTQVRLVNARHSTLLVVAADNKTLPRLPNVQSEIRQVVDAAASAGVTIDAHHDDSTTQDIIAASLESAQLVHVASHGIQHPSEPLKSGLCLNDGVLTVERLMKLDLNDAFLAFLSACETAKGDKEQPDQTIHLAATLLFTGFKSVVGTMWTMNDSDGPAIAKLFYEKLFEKETINADSIPYALDHAVSTLRKRGVPWQRWATFIHMRA